MDCKKCFLNTKTYQFLIAKWDEQLGPKVCASHGILFFGLSDEKIQIQSLVDNLFMSAMAIYGSELKIDRPACIFVPIYYLKMASILYFNYIPDETTRSGQQFIMFALLSHNICDAILNKTESIFKNNFHKCLDDKREICSSSTKFLTEIEYLISDVDAIIQNESLDIITDCSKYL
ncbi:MAG: hypothetical protein ACXAC7_02585 [Candidatus Hodarchaeales archaeon]